MKLRSLVSLVFVALLSLAPASAHADPVSFLRGQFTDSVVNLRPVGGAAEIAQSRRAMYWLQVQNPGAPTTITVVWKLDGRVVWRQPLAVRTGAHYTTWAQQRLHRATSSVEVDVLDATGNVIHTETMTVGA